MVIVIMDGRQCTYNTYKGSTIEVRMSSLALGSNVTSSIVLLAHSQNKSGIFAFPPCFFCFAFDSSCLFSEHLADSAAFNAASSATKILLNYNSGLFLFSPQCHEFCQLLQVLCTSTVQHFLQAQGLSSVSFTNVFLSFRACTHSFVILFCDKQTVSLDSLQL